MGFSAKLHPETVLSVLKSDYRVRTVSQQYESRHHRITSCSSISSGGKRVSSKSIKTKINLLLMNKYWFYGLVDGDGVKNGIVVGILMVGKEGIVVGTVGKEGIVVGMVGIEAGKGGNVTFGFVVGVVGSVGRGVAGWQWCNWRAPELASTAESDRAATKIRMKQRLQVLEVAILD
ncbi:hypothetical protein POM88_004125 [Heracleum sosnowskyi]|uniref:Uncharacterized protein n=1 Tax=Heracleum sosnowskyi TaxID=360622 RepID=A0AAD8N7D9_9APIA|nr:hypothetical protein POM88_004125 [Heracleum sosnowskyi]